MTSEALSIADDMLRSGFERWLRLEEVKAEIGDDLKELFAELKGHGFTPKALRESFRRVRNINDADQQEHDALVDLYVESLSRRAHPAPAHEKTLKNSRPAPPRQAAKPEADDSLPVASGTLSKIEAPRQRPEAAAKSAAHIDTPAAEKSFAKGPSEADGPGGMHDECAFHPATQFESAPPLTRAATAGDGPTQSPVTGPVFPSQPTSSPVATAPEPDASPPVVSSGAPIPDELIVPHIRKDHVPTKPLNPACMKAARGERCILSHSNDVWCARQECVSAAANLKQVAA